MIKFNSNKSFAELQDKKVILTVCTYCNKVKDNKGYWNVLEQDVVELSEFHLSHGLCPECYTQSKIDAGLD